MIGRRGFIGAILAILPAARAWAGFPAKSLETNDRPAARGWLPGTWPVLGERVIITQWFPSRGPVDWAMTVSGISWQASNEMDEPGDFTMLVSGYQDPGDGLGRRTFNLSLGMDQARFQRDGAGVLRINWWPWGRP